MTPIYLDKEGLTLEEVLSVARHGQKVALSEKAEQKVMAATKLIEQWVAENKVIYGITTGFGALCNTRISGRDTVQLQKNILMSHAAGVGKPFDPEVVRAAMAIRVRDLSMGHSGCRMETINAMVTLLNEDVVPVVPEKGSVGASGDLAPMSHLGLVLIGMGEAFYKGERMPGKQALDKIGLKPLDLSAGEGLALINGTQIMAAGASLLGCDALRLSKTADIACALSLEVLMGSSTEFDPRIHNVRPHKGQIAAADNMLRMTRESGIIESHAGCARIQDAYTLRCSPQIHGASKDAVSHFRQVVTTEISSTTTNPLIFPETGDFILGGNFHGQPLALAADYLAMALSEFGSVSERRVERLVNPQLSELPAFLVENGGLNSGFMIAQYTAAALVSENKVLAHPASVDSIPTSANKEDHVSMGSISVRKCREICENVEAVLSVELLCAVQAMDLLRREKFLEAGKGTRQAYQIIRQHIPYLDKDRVIAQDIENMKKLVRSEKIIKAVEQAIGELR